MAHNDDIILTEDYAYQGTLQLRANTQKLYFPNGRRKVNRISDNILRSIFVSFPPKDYEARYAMIRLFNAVGGDADTFNARDPGDFNTTDGFMETDPSRSSYWVDNVTKLDQPMQNTTDNTFVGDGSTTDFQLVKRYLEGSSAALTRAIVKPYSASGFPVFALDGADIVDPTDGSLDYTTGIFTFNSPPGIGTVPTWGGPFYMPVEIANPDIMFKFTTAHLNEILTVEFREVTL